MSNALHGRALHGRIYRWVNWYFSWTAQTCRLRFSASKGMLNVGHCPHLLRGATVGIVMARARCWQSVFPGGGGAVSGSGEWAHFRSVKMACGFRRGLAGFDEQRVFSCGGGYSALLEHSTF